ncbi:MAG: bicyclomycin resistance protein [Burkholderiales bacterium]|nr:bicyclomycin resistance protein [Burkholderiales bacterium]MDE1926383.1 bicyclomycin resistance protein [Burkholderiales bacterium]MDE2157336.1 bicyclomycin resistance protein [Burkholderiales bacterium]MDE2502170.1 bicyclomycin resistance protein [Burkholderiales bacterium]
MHPTRRHVLAAGLTGLGTRARARAASAASPKKTLRYAFLVSETGFDPAQVTDYYSRIVIAGILEAPLEFAFLARPATLRPATAAALPEIDDDYRHFTFRIQPGIHFAPDPAFGGRARELVAEDYVYAIKRHYDPRWKSGNLYILENAQILGLSELRRRLMAANRPFDYDAPVEGLRALDRYTFEVRLARPAPRLLYQFADGSFTGAVAREVVEAYGDRISAHPVGTGAFRLAQWTHSSRIELERNPTYRERLYDEQPPADDARLQAVAAQFKGRRLPLVDRVVISIIEQPQPRWLAFLNHEQDLIEVLPNDYAPIAIPNNRLAPNLARDGVGMVRYARSDVSLSYFAMNHPVVGGYSPERVALRRAICLAVDIEREIRDVRRGQAIPAQGPIAPGCWGYDPRFKSEMSDFDRARAMALLDLYGYVDRNGDGWREQPDGSPLLIEYATSPDQTFRQLAEQWQKNMDAIGIRMRFQVAQWPEQLKSARAGKLMMWGVGWTSTQPDGDDFLALAYGPNAGQSNLPRFDLAAYNAICARQRELPDGPERQALMTDAQRYWVAYMPYKVHVHRIYTDLTHPWVLGYDRNLYVRDFWRYVDIDPQRQLGLEAA